MAKITVAFDAWKDGKVARTQHDVSIVFPKKIDLKLDAVSARLAKELIHPNKAGSPTSIRFSPDGKRLIAGDYPGGVVCLWNVETGKREITIDTGRGHGGFMPYFFVDSNWVTLFAENAGKRTTENVEKDGVIWRRWEFDGSVKAWSLADGQLQKTYHHNPKRLVSGIRVSPDGFFFLSFESLPGLYARQAKGAVSLWDARTGKHVALSEDIGSGGHFSPNGRLFATTATVKDNRPTSLKMFDTPSAKELWSIPITEKYIWFNAQEFSQDGSLVLFQGRKEKMDKDQSKILDHFDLFETATARKIASFAGEEGVWLHGSVSPNPRTLAVTAWRGSDPKVVLFGIPEKRALKTIVLGKQSKDEFLYVSTQAFSPDSTRLAIIAQLLPNTRDDDFNVFDAPQPRVHLIDIAAGEIRETLVLPQGFSRDLCFSPDGRTLAVGGHGRVLLFDVSQNPR